MPVVLIGAHVSTAGGLAKAVARGAERNCDAIQIFNQSPRMWRPTNYGDEDFAAFREAFDASSMQSVVIHAIYLLNPASVDAELRRKSIDSLVHALRVGDAIGADGVVLHSGAAKGEPLDAALKRACGSLRTALDESDHCRLLLENTAGAQGLLGRDLHELAALIDGIGGDERLGVCIDSCHALASGYEIRTPEATTALVDELDALFGLERLRCLHVNDSKTPLGGNSDRHALIAEGEIGADGFRAFLSEPRFKGLPAFLETHGPKSDGAPPDAQLKLTRRLRDEGIAARG